MYMNDQQKQTITNETLPSSLLQAFTTTQFITIPQTTINYQELYDLFKNLEQVTYLLVKLEHHEDGGLHIHMVIRFKSQQRISFIHKRIMQCNGIIGGLVDYDKVKNINASINYLKKTETSVEGCPPLEHGEIKTAGRQTTDKTEYNEAILEALEQAKQGNTQEALEQIKTIDPMKYIQYKQQLTENIKTENATRKKYTAPDYSIKNVILSPKQKEVWDLLQSTPKARRIIWVSGNYGSGKSFLYNYIKANHEYSMYDAGQSASLDNVVYGYDEEGVIAWDLPRTFNFNDLGDTIASVIEKFSDFGQSITSKKYSGKTQKVLGHAIVFSNSPPIEQLSHRDIIYINLDDKHAEEVKPITYTKKTVISKKNTIVDEDALKRHQEQETQDHIDHSNQLRKYTAKIRYNIERNTYDKLIVYNTGVTRHISYTTLQEAEEDDPPIIY